MRLRNVKNKEDLYNSKYLIKNPENYKGEFKSLFNNDNPICLEIGTGKGDFVINMALKYPAINFIGVEKYDSVLLRCVQKIEDIDIPNLKLLLLDATEIDDIFGKEIEKIYLNFSDPWPKKRHSKRRLSSEFFLKKYDKIFKGNPHIIMKTDNLGLFEFSLVSYSQFGYKLNEVSLDYNDSENVETEYETKFRSLGKPIYMTDVSKCK